MTMQHTKTSFPRKQRKARDPRLATRSSLPRALTLIELLVVIVILTTIVGGVIPVLSPNNDTRKIRAATRGLQAYINLAQANAARTGRPYGIAFREANATEGAAFEVFGIEVPPAFAGFSSDSRIRNLHAEDFWNIRGASGSVHYGFGEEGTHNQGDELLFPQFDGRDLYSLIFQQGTVPLNGTVPVVLDQLPPRMFRNGDIVDVEGNLFMVVEHPRFYQYFEDPLDDLQRGVDERNDFLDIANFRGPYKDHLLCVLLNEDGHIPSPGAKPYKIRRRPVNSSDEPYQLPAGIVIDMQASVLADSVAAGIPNRFPIDNGSLYTNRSGISDPGPDTIGIIFSPTGSVDRVLFNGIEITTVSRIVLTIGRNENAGIDPEGFTGDEQNETPWTLQQGEEIEAVQERINWLNPDSRLLSIVPSNGRVVVSQPAFLNRVNADGERLYVSDDFDDDYELAAEQIEAAHAFAREMTTVGGK